ncbi:hypothetical protein C27AD_05338 [Salinisphaera hydrothermalis C27AD]
MMRIRRRSYFCRVSHKNGLDQAVTHRIQSPIQRTRVCGLHYCRDELLRILGSLNNDIETMAAPFFEAFL